jgi:hypothetical protein
MRSLVQGADTQPDGSAASTTVGILQHHYHQFQPPSLRDPGTIRNMDSRLTTLPQQHHSGRLLDPKPYEVDAGIFRANQRRNSSAATTSTHVREEVASRPSVQRQVLDFRTLGRSRSLEFRHIHVSDDNVPTAHNIRQPVV